MERMPTGEEIVAAMAGDRAWWRLRAGDIQPWVKTLHASATEELTSRTEWIGDAWDGSSDIAVGSHTVAATKVRRLVSELGGAVRRLKLQGVTSPDAGGVRQCLGGLGARQMLVFDVDLGDCVLPIGVDEWSLREGEFASCGAMASRMAEHVRIAHAKRGQIAARELRLRRAIEQTAAAIGNGVAPLWLRMDAVPLREDPEQIAYREYVMLLVILNDCLRWSPVGTERISTVKHVRDHCSWYAKTQRSRAAALSGLNATGSEGSISEVALALIQERGLDPVATFRQAVEARLADRRGAVDLARNGRPERLFYVDGALHATIGFQGGHYYRGQLTLWGDWPEQLAIGARKRPLAAYVDHPAFVSTGVTVTKGKIRAGAMDLDHRTRLIPIEKSAPAANAPMVALAA